MVVISQGWLFPYETCEDTWGLREKVLAKITQWEGIILGLGVLSFWFSGTAIYLGQSLTIILGVPPFSSSTPVLPLTLWFFLQLFVRVPC